MQITDPLANMMAAANYVRSEYYGGWLDELASETVKPRPEMEEIMERAASMPRLTEGGFVRGGPTVPVWMSPGERVLTPEMADRLAREMIGRYSPAERAAMDEGIRAAVAELEEPDDYPEPPQLPCF
jgi:hypothetical protein